MNRFLFILIACVLGLPRLSANAEEPASITAQNYCRFLKYVAISDPHCFYDEKMALDSVCILREGTPGNYAYSVLPGKENQSVSYLSWHDAACYVNWNQQGEDHLSDDLTRSSGGFQVDNAAIAQNSDLELKSNIVHFSLINDKTLDDVRLPSQEPPSWISYMMIPFLFLAEEGNPEDRVLPHDEESSHLEEKARENINEHPGLSHANKSPGLSGVLMPFIQHYNRADNMSIRKKEYQKELETLAPDSNRGLMLNHLVPILEKAISYQHALTGHLIDNVRTLDDPKKVASKTFLNFIDAMMINDRPNKVELIAKQIEEDYEHLAGYQNKLSEVQTLIESQPGQLNGLFESCEHLNKAIEFQRTLIEQRALYAPLLDPPCEQLNTTTQANVDQYKWKLVETEALVSREYFLGQVDYLSIQVNIAQGLNQPDKARYLNNAGIALFNAAEETQKPPAHRNSEAINLFKRAANLLQKAANAWNPDQPKKAYYLNGAGDAFFHAAGEAQKTPELRNQEVINWLQRAADLYQEAGNAWNPDQAFKARYFSNTGTALLHAAQEAQKPPAHRNLEAINLFQRAAHLYQEAVNAWDPHQSKKEGYLNEAGTALFRAAQEAQKPEPNPEVIARLVKEAEEFEEKAINPPSSCIIS